MAGRKSDQLIVLGERISFHLLDAQGDTTTLFVDVQNHDFHFVADLYDFRRVDVLVGATRAPCKGSDSPLCKERMKLTVETNLERIAAKCCEPPVEERGAGHRRCSEAKTARHVLWEPGVGNCPR